MQILRICAHPLVYIFKHHGFMCTQLQKCFQSCAHVQEASLKNILKTLLHKYYLRFTHNCSIMIYTHSLTSSSSENLHELLSSVIILVHVPIAESASMSGTVSAA